MIDQLIVQDFTVFRNAKFEFVPGINVFVGANATGKTHVLKLLYAIQLAQFEQVSVDSMLSRIFRPEVLEDLVRHGKERRFARVNARWDGMNLPVEIDPVDFIRDMPPNWQGVTRPVYIPVKDMLANSVGFLSLYDQRFIDFDQTYRDILTLAFTPALRAEARSVYGSLLEQLTERLEGHVEVQGERFYLTGRSGRLEMHLVAEGWRKLALLYLLIANGSLGSGRVLYWDEPETNLNPSLMDDVVSVLLTLARGGAQIFLATHDYIILKELELQKRAEDTLRFFALNRHPKDGSVSVHPAAIYAEISPNPIAEEFERIYDLEIDRALGG